MARLSDELGSSASLACNTGRHASPVAIAKVLSGDDVQSEGKFDFGVHLDLNLVKANSLDRFAYLQS